MAAKEKTTKTSGKKRNRESTTNLLMQMGLDIFSEIGFDAATTKIIATRADVSEALITRYFKSKQGLLEAIADHMTNKIVSIPLSYERQDSLEKEISRYIIERRQIYHQHHKFIRLCYSRIPLDKKIGKRMSKALLNGSYVEFTKRLHHFQQQGEIPNHLSLDTVFHNLLLQITGAFMLGEMILGLNSKEMDEYLLNFARTYAAGLQSQIQN